MYLNGVAPKLATTSLTGFIAHTAGYIRSFAYSGPSKMGLFRIEVVENVQKTLMNVSFTPNATILCEKEAVALKQNQQHTSDGVALSSK
jgi:hypothetical protein